MTDRTYNGWTNRETWLIIVWFDPESKEDVQAAKAQLEEDLENLPGYLKDLVNDSDINWEELESHFDDEDQDDEDEED